MVAPNQPASNLDDLEELEEVQESETKPELIPMAVPEQPEVISKKKIKVIKKVVPPDE